MRGHSDAVAPLAFIESHFTPIARHAQFSVVDCLGNERVPQTQGRATICSATHSRKLALTARSMTAAGEDTRRSSTTNSSPVRTADLSPPVSPSQPDHPSMALTGCSSRPRGTQARTHSQECRWYVEEDATAGPCWAEARRRSTDESDRRDAPDRPREAEECTLQVNVLVML